jgi:hypothetical protein
VRSIDPGTLQTPTGPRTPVARLAAAGGLGGVPERPKGPVLKTGVGRPTVGSNPTPSAHEPAVGKGATPPTAATPDTESRGREPFVRGRVAAAAAAAAPTTAQCFILRVPAIGVALG